VPDEDARITDFLPGEDDSEQVPGEDDGEQDPAERDVDGDDHDGGEERDGGEPAESDGTVVPAKPTATWRADGACEACGAAVERRWHDDGALVCADCKDW
jgi:hypothetical protein